MSSLSQFSGELKVIIDGKEMEVKPIKKEKWAIMKLGAKANNMTEEDFAKLDQIQVDILKRSDPTSTQDEIDSFLLQHGEAFLSELSIAFGWVTREKIEERTNELKKNREEIPVVEEEQEAKKN